MSSGGIGSVSQAAPSLLQVQENGMLQQLKGDETTKNDVRIEKASKQFEAMLLGSWLKEAEKSFASLSGNGKDDATRTQMMSLGVQTLAQGMAANGGIGIAKMIAQAMETAAARQNAGAAGVTAPEKGGEIEKKS